MLIPEFCVNCHYFIACHMLLDKCFSMHFCPDLKHDRPEAAPGHQTIILSHLKMKMILCLLILKRISPTHFGTSASQPWPPSSAFTQKSLIFLAFIPFCLPYFVPVSWEGKAPHFCDP